MIYGDALARTGTVDGACKAATIAAAMLVRSAGKTQRLSNSLRGGSTPPVPSYSQSDRETAK